MEEAIRKKISGKRKVAVTNRTVPFFCESLKDERGTMEKKEPKSGRLDGLGVRAEHALSGKAVSSGETSADVKKLIHEVDVYQTELKMQNEQLRLLHIEATEAREKYADLYDFAPVGYFTFDKKGHVIEANVTGTSLLGSEKRSLIGQPFHRFIMPGHLRIFQSHLQKVIELRSKQSCKLKLTRKDGSLFDALIETIAVIGSKGKFDHYRSSVTDITEITEAEGEMARLATFPQLNPNPIAEVDFAGQVHYLNPAAERLFPDLRQRGSEHPWLIDWESLVRDLRDGGGKVSIREVKVGGRWCQQTFHLVEETQRIRIYGIDITERVQAEDALRHSEARYRSMFHDNSAPMLLIDPATAEIVDANPAARRYYGYTHTELRTKKITDINILTPKQVFEEMERAKARERRSFEFSHRLASGEIRAVEVLSGPIELEGRLLLYSTVHDITERKLSEMALKERTAQLEATNKELESFSYSVSHDLRAPLRAIDGYARLILKKHGDKFDADTLDKFNVIRSSTHLMGQLIDDLLTFSRLGRKHMSLTYLDMDILMKDAWKELQASDPERNKKLTVNSMPPGYGDRALIKQVLINLLSNAVKFTKYKDVVNIEVGGCADGNESVYYVRDNGVGFDMAYYDKLFGVFQRLHSTDQFEGTGVGLATVQRIIHRHGGRVWAEGKVDEGACFYFALNMKE